MEVYVQNNELERALKTLKKKLIREGFFSELRERQYHQKPSVKRKKKRSRANRRRKKAEREGRQ
ncbi:MAG: 30S ribosomal protein S21 [bacterium]